MKMRLCTVFILLAPAVFALDFDSGSYGSLSDIYHPDKNAGLTAFPVLNVPMGGRAEGMGTAFTAVADDLSFIEYNPSASSMLDFTEFGFFHNNWIADTKVESLVFTTRMKNLGYGAAAKWLYTPFSEYNMYGNRVSKGYYSEFVATLNVSYNFLAGYYFGGISIGANLKGAFRFMPDYSDADDRGNNEGTGTNSGMSQSAGMAMIDLGALTRFDFLKSYTSREKNTSLGLVIRNLGPPSKGESLPTSITAGVSYKPLRPLTLAFDYTVPFNMQGYSLSEQRYWAAGLNLEVTEFLSMRAGLLARYGAYRVTLGSAVELGKIIVDLNYSLDLLTQFTPLNRVSLGISFNFGDQGRADLRREVDAVYLEGLEAYAAGRYEEANSRWEEALGMDPGFDPAKEGITLINNSRALETRINEMETLDF
ncbi:MAG: UPF0164 family protein [Treponema sp.]|jgi:hypothetical protein|nr:UPF0164 family protein [Treponema sp.]